MQVKIFRRGNGLGIRLPKGVAEQLGFKDGANAEIAVEKGCIVIAPTRRRTIEDLVAGTTPEAIREAFDWGRDARREKV